MIEVRWARIEPARGRGSIRGADGSAEWPQDGSSHNQRTTRCALGSARP
ncbi:hypothetical protein [Amycolatopsis sp. WQ 127309]|nr:hypothetical protein [Amycolatopsis sp. WQ 127309]UOZ09730.1 hypothetical protein MUY22_16220 [Amycolatopsis sp. WQ 127309]